MKSGTIISVLITFMLMILCGCMPESPGVTLGNPISSGLDISSPMQSSSLQSKEDWLLSATYREAEYSAYMTMEQYDRLFGSSGMVPSTPVLAPDGGSILYFYPAEFEEASALFRYDLATETAQPVLTQQDIGASQSVKWVAWQEDGALLLVIGYRYGTISPGGAVYLLKPEQAPALRLLYSTRKETEQVLTAQLQDTTLTMTVAVFDADFMEYEQTERVIQVNPRQAPIAQLGGVLNVPQNSLAVIFNYPTAEQLAAYPNLDVYEHDTSGEELLLVPSHEGTHILLEEMAFDQTLEQFVPSAVRYDKMSLAGQALHIKAVRPEGGPQLRLTLTYGDHAAQYYITYNGKDGTPEREDIMHE